MNGGSDEVDHHFKSMTRHPDLHHFKKGISLILQWTRNEYKNMQKIFIGVIANAADDRVIRTVCAVVDFISYARFEVHTEKSLEKMDNVATHCLLEAVVALVARTRDLKAILLEDRSNKGARMCSEE